MKIILSILTSVTIWSFFNLTSYADSTIENLEQSCYDWNFQACYDLAVEYNKGEKVVKDSSKAHELFMTTTRIDRDHNDVVACF